MDREGWSFILLFICIAITIGTVIPIGYSFGVVNAPAAFIKSWANDSAQQRYSKQLTDSQLTLVMSGVVSIFQIGGMVGSLLAPFCNTALGRKGSLIVGGIILTISGFLQFFCRIVNSLEMLLLGRLAGGIAAALIYTTQPMYLVELAPSELSGSVGVFTCIGITGGIVLGQIFSFNFTFGNERYWHCALAGYLLFVLIGLTPIIIFPESPRFLVSKGRLDEAKTALARLRSSSDRVDQEFSEIVAASKATVEKTSMAAVIVSSKLRMPLMLVCSFHFVQQMSGINVIWYYSVAIFTDAGFSLVVALWLNFAEGTLNFIVALFGPYMMSHFSRRIMIMMSCFFSAIFLTLLSLGLKIINISSAIAIACILFLSMYIIAFNLGLGPMPFFIGSELLDVPPRASVMAFGSLSNWISNFVLGLAFPTMQEAIGPFAFLPCSFICLYGFFFTCMYLPETRNRDVMEVAPLLEHGFKSKIN